MGELAFGKMYLAMAFFLAGSSVVAVRYVAAFLPPFSITFISLLIAVLTACLLDGRNILRIVKNGTASLWLYLFMQAFFGIFLFRIFLTYGVGYTSSSAAGAITGAIPATTAVLTILVLREPLSPRRLGGVLAAFVGIGVLNGLPFALPESSNLIGNTLVFAAVVCESLFNVLARKMHLLHAERKVPITPIAQAGIVSALAMLLCLVPMLAEGQWTNFTSLPGFTWLGLWWYGSIITIAAFTCFFAGAKRCDGYTISTFTGFMPLSSLILSVGLLHEKIAFHQWIGSAFILLSILIMSRREPAR